MKRLLLQLTRALKRAADVVIARLTVWLLRAIRHIDQDRMADFAGVFMRRVGPWLREHRLGRENLVAAFPQKSADEIENILSGAWDNLGRLAAEFAYVDRLTFFLPWTPASADISYGPGTYERFLALREDGKPALIFAAHLANWELPSIAAARFGLDTAVLYRRPNIGGVADAVQEIRGNIMGELVAGGPMSPFHLANALEANRHVAMLVDQHFGRGVEVRFFGRPCLVNPLLAMLTRHFDCPIHGTRVVRLPGRKFRVDLTEAVPPARDADGKIELAGTMQAVTSVVEGWVREHPEQWLWQHRRWR